jgi:hypothetical protein
MDISILGFKLNLEVLILIGIVYLILAMHTVCGCASIFGKREGMDNNLIQPIPAPALSNETKKKEGSAPFLKLLQEKYVSYLNNKKVELEESDFEIKNLKTTLLKVTKHYHSDKKDQIMAHIYVRHMGDMYGGKVIAKRVPGSGKCYEFIDRPALIKAFDAKLSMDLLDEALLAFDLAIDFFNELQEKIDERRKTNGS